MGLWLEKRNPPDEVLLEFTTELRVLESEFDTGLEVAQLVPTIIAGAVECIAEDLLGCEKLPEGVRQLDLPSPSAPGLFQAFHDLGHEKVASDDRKIRRGLPGIGLFDDGLDAVR